eukprot:TRINITY_DN16111_c0_g1_i1.p1 TRINITY_DN16111_c0_g1~~TRINITY_DN16111_c0_g1_i1.p1  ORF type:complete len:147 (-),score=5.94 TRINITY_DN16111_c0_g1_i1:308-748(-)
MHILTRSNILGPHSPPQESNWAGRQAETVLEQLATTGLWRKERGEFTQLSVEGVPVARSVQQKSTATGMANTHVEQPAISRKHGQHLSRPAFRRSDNSAVYRSGSSVSVGSTVSFSLRSKTFAMRFSYPTLRRRFGAGHRGVQRAA